MKFKFEILKPSEKAIKIIETYEDIGFTVCLQVSENEQWNDDTDYIGFSTIIKGKCNNSMFFTIPKTEFEENITYYDWMPREEFEKLCRQNKDYEDIDLVLTKSKDGFHHRGSIQQFKVLGDIRNFAIGYYGDGSWWDGGGRFDAEPFKYVKLIKCEKE